MKENFDGFIHDTILWTGNCDCSHRRRIDFRKLIGNTLLCIEVDEYQHKRYKDKDEEKEVEEEMGEMYLDEYFEDYEDEEFVASSSS